MQRKIAISYESCNAPVLIIVSSRKMKYCFHLSPMMGFLRNTSCLLQALEELGMISQIKRFAGASAGAMTASLMAVGYDSKDIQGFLSQDMSKMFLGKTSDRDIYSQSSWFAKQPFVYKLFVMNLVYLAITSPFFMDILYWSTSS